MGVGFLAGLVWVGTQVPDKNLHVVFCDVGQGDAILVVKGSFQMVVDGGPNGSGVLSCLGRHLPFWDRKIEVVVNTHPQKDHLGGLDELLERYEVKRLVINGVFGTGEDARRLRNLVIKRNVGVVLPKEGDVLRIGSLQFDILWPEKRVGSELAWTDLVESDFVGEMVLGRNTDVNEVSVVGLLRYGKFAVLLTGDIGENQERILLSSGKVVDIDVLKVAHHGSKYSSSQEFVERVKPEIAVVQVGKNRFGHPTNEVLERLRGAGAKVLRTDLDGEVEVVSDGERYWVKEGR
jgi:competence protein ComEC